MNQSYNRQYQPPIPVLSVRLYSPISEQFTEPIEALVDTGSDATLVPLAHLLTIAAEETSPGWLISITGQRKAVSLYFADIYVGSSALAGIRVIGEPDTDELILGRDVLNKLPLFLDGPNSTLTVLDDRSTARLRRGS